MLFTTQSCSPAAGCKHLVSGAGDCFFNWQISVGFSDVFGVQHIIKEDNFDFQNMFSSYPFENSFTYSLLRNHNVEVGRIQLNRQKCYHQEPLYLHSKGPAFAESRKFNVTWETNWILVFTQKITQLRTVQSRNRKLDIVVMGLWQNPKGKIQFWPWLSQCLCSAQWDQLSTHLGLGF